MKREFRARCAALRPLRAHRTPIEPAYAETIDHSFALVAFRADLDGRVDYGHLFSMELPPTVLRMDVNLTQGTSCLPMAPSQVVCMVSALISDAKGSDVFKSPRLRHLRNVAFPPQLREQHLPTFDNASDLGRILPAKRNTSLPFSFLCNGYALRGRFDRLPVHRACYYHAHEKGDAAVRALGEALAREAADARVERLRARRRPPRRTPDCLGFTPLHVLCCSTRHRTAMYEMLIARHPEDLIAEDRWGDIPLLYALWGRAPRAIVDLLATKMREHLPGYAVNWAKMVRTFCAATAPPSCVEILIDTVRNSFPEQVPRLRCIEWGHMVGLLCAEGRASEEHMAGYVQTIRAALPEHHGGGDMSRGFFRAVLDRKFGFQPFWIKVPISERLWALTKREWREDLEGAIRGCPVGGTERARGRRAELVDAVFDRLDRYENVERLWVVELALWKAKIEDAGGVGREGGGPRSRRSQCRITSGADVVVPNVMPYLRSEFDFGREILGDGLPRKQRRH